MNRPTPSILDTLFRLVDNPITISIAFALWAIPFQYVLHNGFPIDPQDYSTLEKFIEWFGIPYGFILAGVLVYVWTQFDALDIDFDREADAVFTLHNTILLVVNPALNNIQSRIIEHIRNYVTHTLQNYRQEWRAEPLAQTARNNGDILLVNIRSAIGELIHSEEREVITTELLTRVNEIVDIRGDRLARSKQRINLPIKIIAIVASGIWIVPFIALNYQNFFLGTITTAGVTFIVVSLLLVIFDLDNPFTGTWVIHEDSWGELSGKIRQQ